MLSFFVKVSIGSKWPTLFHRRPGLLLLRNLSSFAGNLCLPRPSGHNTGSVSSQESPRVPKKRKKPLLPCPSNAASGAAVLCCPCNRAATVPCRSPAISAADRSWGLVFFVFLWPAARHLSRPAPHRGVQQNAFQVRSPRIRARRNRACVRLFASDWPT